MAECTLVRNAHSTAGKRSDHFSGLSVQLFSKAHTKVWLNRSVKPLHYGLYEVVIDCQLLTWDIVSATNLLLKWDPLSDKII